MPTADTPTEAGIGLSMIAGGTAWPTAILKPDGAATDAVFCPVIQVRSVVTSAATRVSAAGAGVAAAGGVAGAGVAGAGAAACAKAYPAARTLARATPT